jgi:plastocyanin
VRRLGVTCLLAAAVLAGCGGLKKGGLTPVGNEEATKPPPAKDEATVEMKAISFRPETIHVNPGGTVTWVNRDQVAHTVTEGDELYNSFNSGEVAPGKRYTRSFSKQRKIGYRCTIHPNMEGTIFVGDAR